MVLTNYYGGIKPAQLRHHLTSVCVAGFPSELKPGVNATNDHSVIFPTGVVHRVENGWGLTKVAVVLLNGLLW